MDNIAMCRCIAPRTHTYIFHDLKFVQFSQSALLAYLPIFFYFFLRAENLIYVDDAGKGREVLALQAPVPDQRITYHPYSAPLHRIKNENMLPVQLLTPFQARGYGICS